MLKAFWLWWPDSFFVCSLNYVLAVSFAAYQCISIIVPVVYLQGLLLANMIPMISVERKLLRCSEGCASAANHVWVVELAVSNQA